MSVFILVALEQELGSDIAQSMGYSVHYMGVGKINATLNTCHLIHHYQPKLIINYGTAGSLKKEMKGLVEVTTFHQRDMDATGSGFALGETPYDPIHTIQTNQIGVSCGTGDSFVTSTPTLQTDLVDMEAYAVAKVCHIMNIPFRCFKFISDHANQSASQDWEKNCAMGQSAFINMLTQLQPLPPPPHIAISPKSD